MKYRLFNNTIKRFTDFLKRISLPGFDKVPIYNVIKFFIDGMQHGAITTRGGSIAYQFLMASLPALIFFFTLIPHIPIENFQQEVLDFLKNMLPHNVFLTIQTTLEDMFVKRSGLQFFGFLIAMFFATRAVDSMIRAFNATYHTLETRDFTQRILVAALMVLIITLMFAVSVSMIIFSKMIINKLIVHNILEVNITYYFILAGKWIIIIAMVFFGISFLYYFAPAKRTKWRMFSAGSSLATILMILSSLGFSYYVNNFGQFNKLFGSIGTLIVIMIWINFNALSLLIGFELNASITHARIEKEEGLDVQMRSYDEDVR